MQKPIAYLVEPVVVFSSCAQLETRKRCQGAGQLCWISPIGIPPAVMRHQRSLADDTRSILASFKILQLERIYPFTSAWFQTASIP